MRLISKMIIRLQLFFSHLLKIEPTAKYKSRSLTLLAPFIPNPMGIQYILTIEKRNMHYYSGFYISLHQFAIDYTPLVAKYAVQQYVTMYEEAANTQVIVQFSACFVCFTEFQSFTSTINQAAIEMRCRILHRQTR